MIDMKWIRNDPEKVKENIRKKFQDEKLPLVDEVVELDQKFREAKVQGDELRSQRKSISKKIGALMGQGKKEEAEAVKAEVGAIGTKLEELEKAETELSARIREIMLVIPNFIDDSVPIGKDDSENVEVERFGEPVVPDVTFTYDEKHDLMVGKSFDCRLGCASIVSTLRELQGEELAVDVVGACCSQEEVGTRGSQVTCRTVNPDIAIVFEGCPADDTCVEAYMVQTAIKKGPMLRHVDARMITNPRYQRYALALAGELGIPVQDAVRSGGSTNGANIHLSGQGVPTIVIGVPVRYAHTHYGISAYADYENGVKLAVEIIKRLNADVIGSF